MNSREAFEAKLEELVCHKTRLVDEIHEQLMRGVITSEECEERCDLISERLY